LIFASKKKEKENICSCGPVDGLKNSLYTLIHDGLILELQKNQALEVWKALG